MELVVYDSLMNTDPRNKKVPNAKKRWQCICSLFTSMEPKRLLYALSSCQV